MKKVAVVLSGFVLLASSSAVFAQQASWGNALKAAGQAAALELCPQAQTVVDQAKAKPTVAAQENFIIAKAKEFMAAKNYQAALELATYVQTKLDAKSLDAKTIITDAKAALLKMAQDKLGQTKAQASGQAKVNAAQQVKTDATNTVSGLKSLFGTQK